MSKDAIAFFGNEASAEQLAEIAPILRVWRNRKSLKGETFSHCLQVLKFKTSTVGLRMILREEGVDQFRECCLSAWILGVLPLDEHNQKIVSASLSQYLNGKGELISNQFPARFSRAILRTFTLSALMVFSVGAFTLAVQLASSDFDGNIHAIYKQFCVYAIFSAIRGLITTLALSIPLFPIISLLCKALDAQKLTKIRVYAAQALGRIGLPDSAGALSHASLGINWKVATSAQIALCELLPKISSESFGQLPSETIPNLSKLLRRISLKGDFALENPLPSKCEVRSDELSFAILDAFEQIGDSRALKAVVEVSGSAPNRIIQKRASHILPILEARAQNENDRSMLLRGASEPVKPNELLRPVLEKNPIETEGLLRPNYNLEEEAPQILKQG